MADILEWGWPGNSLFTGTRVTPGIEVGLVHYWNLGQTPPTFTDSVGGLNLTLQGGTATSVAGKNGNAVRFNGGAGTNNCITSSTFTLGQTTNGVTWTGWVRRSATPTATATWCSSTVSATSGWNFQFNSSGRPLGNVFIGTNTNLILPAMAGGPSIGNDAWHLVIITFNEHHDKVLRIRIPSLGYLMESSPGTSEFLDISPGVGVSYGARAPGSSLWWNTGQSAYIDECAIWDRSLTVDERAFLYNGRAGRFYPF